MVNNLINNLTNNMVNTMIKNYGYHIDHYQCYHIYGALLGIIRLEPFNNMISNMIKLFLIR